MDTLPEISQRKFEQFFRALRERGVTPEGVSAPEYAGAVVRAAVEVGWLALDVDEASPREVIRLKRQIQAYLEEVMSDPLASPSPSPTT